MICTRFAFKSCLPKSNSFGFKSLVNIVTGSSEGRTSMLCLRHISTSSTKYNTGHDLPTQERDGKVLVRVYEQGKTLPHQQWVMRMNNQNGYLSWCRNAYICLSVSVAVSMSPLFIPGLDGSKYLGEELTYVLGGLALLSVSNMVFGSMEFLYQLFKTRKLTQISWLALCIYTIFVIIHSSVFCDFVYTIMQTFADSEQLDHAISSFSKDGKS